MSVESCVTIRSQILQRLTTTSGHGIEDAALSLLALRNSGADPHRIARDATSLRRLVGPSQY